MSPTEQEALWSGNFGDEYTRRNAHARSGADRAFWRRVLSEVAAPRRVLELGAGTGNNLRALRRLLPQASLEGVEINQAAHRELARVADVAHRASIFEFTATVPDWDLVFTKGLLIHIAPAELPKAYRLLYHCSRRYIVLAEYYAPEPIEVPYRKNERALWKRDFASDMLALFPTLHVLDYGFVWRGDPQHPQDDVTWFVLEKPA